MQSWLTPNPRVLQILRKDALLPLFNCFAEDEIQFKPSRHFNRRHLETNEE